MYTLNWRPVWKYDHLFLWVSLWVNMNPWLSAFNKVSHTSFWYPADFESIRLCGLRWDTDWPLAGIKRLMFYFRDSLSDQLRADSSQKSSAPQMLRCSLSPAPAHTYCTFTGLRRGVAWWGEKAQFVHTHTQTEGMCVTELWQRSEWKSRNSIIVDGMWSKRGEEDCAQSWSTPLSLFPPFPSPHPLSFSSFVSLFLPHTSLFSLSFKHLFFSSSLLYNLLFPPRFFLLLSLLSIFTVLCHCSWS